MKSIEREREWAKNNEEANIISSSYSVHVSSFAFAASHLLSELFARISSPTTSSPSHHPLPPVHSSLNMKWTKFSPLTKLSLFRNIVWGSFLRPSPALSNCFCCLLAVYAPEKLKLTPRRTSSSLLSISSSSVAFSLQIHTRTATDIA